MERVKFTVHHIQGCHMAFEAEYLKALEKVETAFTELEALLKKNGKGELAKLVHESPDFYRQLLYIESERVFKARMAFVQMQQRVVDRTSREILRKIR